MTARRIDIAVPRARFLRWHQRLRARLAHVLPGAEVAFRFEDRGEGWPDGVAPLLSLERLLLRRSQPTLCDACDARAEPEPSASSADIVIDLAGDVAASDQVRVLRPLYDGEASDRNAVAALLSGQAPTIAIQDATTGALLAQGLPSLETADGLTGGLEAVYSRIVSLIEQALTAPPGPLDPPPQNERKEARNPVAFALRNIAFQAARKIYHLCCLSPHWRVGWRFVDGPGVLETGALAGEPWRVMQDRDLNFAADPFPCAWREQTGVFYERLDYRKDRGAIYFQAFDEKGPKGDPAPAIEEPWHLSYPSLIEHEGGLYMLPEASASGAVTLYRCVEFPRRWERVARPIDNVEAADATIFRHDGRFWMTSVVREGAGGYSDTLTLHYAEDLFGPWRAHARWPALVDSRFARPAGAVARVNGALLRPAQDCSQGYGRRLAIMRIDELTPQTFRQTLVKYVEPGARWPGSRLHTINRCGRLECIDGVIFTPRNLALRRFTHRMIDSHAAHSDGVA